MDISLLINQVPHPGGTWRAGGILSVDGPDPAGPSCSHLRHLVVQIDNLPVKEAPDDVYLRRVRATLTDTVDDRSDPDKEPVIRQRRWALRINLLPAAAQQSLADDKACTVEWREAKVAIFRRRIDVDDKRNETKDTHRVIADEDL